MKIKLEKIIEALKETNDMVEYYYNPENGDVFPSNIGDFIDLSVDELDELFGKSIILPSRYEINEYRIMEEFIETIEDNLLRNQLLIAINGKGAFRRFKDTCINFEIIEDWYEFKENCYQELAKEWCNNFNIQYEE